MTPPRNGSSQRDRSLFDWGWRQKGQVKVQPGQQWRQVRLAPFQKDASGFVIPWRSLAVLVAVIKLLAGSYLPSSRFHPENSSEVQMGYAGQRWSTGGICLGDEKSSAVAG
jgi:hypothetical protein